MKPGEGLAQILSNDEKLGAGEPFKDDGILDFGIGD
jgi:hypothetical protein